jgi:hypothetical protein
MEKNKTNELFQRWESILRLKAEEYEHSARKRGETVVEPSLDDICNEMKAFLAGLTN